jgi:hypothetical protein
MEAFGAQDLFEPAQPFPEEQVVAEGLLDGVVDDGHHRDESVEGDQEQDRKDEEPGFLVFGFHAASPASLISQPSA